jgi:thymidylate synthase ThyX
MIKAAIIKDSVSPWGKRITTYVLTYPRFIHSEFNTHRAFSRNASSSRAVPVEKQILSVSENLVYPYSCTSNKRGMQGGPELPADIQDQIVAEWDMARDDAVRHAEKLAKLGLHKQYVNRIIEPFMHISVVCTATDFDNFFALRRHNDAQPEIHALADAMWNAREKSKPVARDVDQWHLPFVDEDEPVDTDEDFSRALYKSVACCARVSYRNHDSTKPTDEQNKELYDRLLSRHPIHASPAEHQAVVAGHKSIASGNFSGGWVQFRKMLQNECVEKYEP